MTEMDEHTIRFKNEVANTLRNNLTETNIDLISSIVAQSEQAKNILRNKGYGWTGLDIVGTVNLVPWIRYED